MIFLFFLTIAFTGLEDIFNRTDDFATGIITLVSDVQFSA